jgi:O-antigen biosynthesis protein
VLLRRLAHAPRALGRSARRVVARLVVHKNGKPRRWLPKILLHADGRPRGLVRFLVQSSDGGPRRKFDRHSLPRRVIRDPAMLGAFDAMPTARRERAILIADSALPLHDQQSGGLRLKTLVQMLGKQNRPMIFVSLTPKAKLPGVLASVDGRGRYERVLRDAGVVAFVYGKCELESWLEAEGAKVRFAFLSFPDVALALLPLVRQYCPYATAIYDMVDFHALRMRREAQLKGDPALASDAAEMQGLEIALAEAADITIAISDDEKKALLALAPSANIDVLPNIFELPAAPSPGPQGRCDVLFLGGFWHKANGDAVAWFVREIWPRILAAAPDCRFLIAGSNPGPDVVALAAATNVVVLGHVEDLAPLYSAARVCVAPLRYGAGVKGKVGQSMAYGLPVVATAIGAEGMGLSDGEHLLIADEPEAFARRVVDLLGDDTLWRAIQTKARAFVESQFSVAALSDKVEALFRDEAPANILKAEFTYEDAQAHSSICS